MNDQQSAMNLLKRMPARMFAITCTALMIMNSSYAQQTPSLQETPLLHVNSLGSKTEKLPYVSTARIQANKDHDFLLVGDYLTTKKVVNEQTKAQVKRQSTGGVIVLHDCQSNRSRYNSLSETIALQSLHTLSLDLRGYGESVAQGFSELEIKKNAKDIVTYQNDVALLTTYWADDLLAGYKYLRNKMDKNKGIAVVASGCSSAYAVSLAEKIHISALVLITPEMTYGDKERYKNLIDIPTYFIGSTHHQASYSTTKELFDWNGAKRTKMQTFKGDKTNRYLINANEYLVSDIALWLKSILH